MVTEETPLSILAAKLLSRGPPSLSALLSRFEEAEEYQGFVKLVREFLPEREREILRQPTPAQQIAAFATRFEDRYFPLADMCRVEMERYADLTSGIPVVPMGIDWEDYHEIASNYRPGFQLMTYLLADPYDCGARVALAEACAEHVPQKLLQRIPEGGLDLNEAHRLLDKSPHEAVAIWGDTLQGETNNYFLDTPMSLLYDTGDIPPWGKNEVEDLTKEWQESQLLWQKVEAFAEWLEKDPKVHLPELLDFIEEKQTCGT